VQNLWVTPEELDSQYTASAVAYEAATTASYILWALSGRKYGGLRTVTERYEFPCAVGAVPARLLSQPGLFNVEPYLTADSGIVNGCGCSGTLAGRHARLRLRGRPVSEVHEVTRGGVVVDPETYTVVNRTYLQGAPGRFLDVYGLEVTYTYGASPPMAGRRAAIQLASEFIKAWDPARGDCQLPDRVTSVSRQGVSYTILDDQGYLDDLRTGLYSVDLFLRSTNPVRALKPSRVFSPDLPRASRTTGPAVLQPVGPQDIVLSTTGETVWLRDLYGIDGGIFVSESWEPLGQIVSAQGALIVDLDASRFTVNTTEGTISFTLTAAETALITDVAVFDLYGVGDNGSLIHVITSSVRPANTVGA
jgi:hypothetical protein